MIVYHRRLKHCVAMIAADRSNTQVLDDNGALPRKFSEVAFAFVLRGEPAKGLVATGQWLPFRRSSILFWPCGAPTP